MRARLSFLFAAAVPACTLAAPALAQVAIDDDRTEGVSTSTINAGEPGDITVESAGSVIVTEGAAVTVDSDNALVNDGTIGSTDADNTVGVRGLGGVTGSILNSGSIRLDETFTSEDTDDDGDFDTAFAQGTGRIGILIEGDSPFVGSVSQDGGGSIFVEGNDSAGVRLAAGLDGDLEMGGTISVVGDNSFGIDAQESITGDVTVDTISVRGENTVAANFSDDIGGQLRINGNVQASGYRETQRRSIDVDRERLDADDLLQGGAAISIGGSIGNGLLINGISDNNDVRASATVQSIGQEPALLVNAGLNPERTTDVVFGRVVETELVFDADGNVVVDDDGVAQTVEVTQDFGFINRGLIRGSALNDGIDSRAVLFTGVDGGVRLIIEGGVLNTGTIEAGSFFGSAVAFEIGPNVQIGPLVNEGSILASVQADADGGDNAIALIVREGSELTSIDNSGSIRARVLSENGDAIAILDETGLLNLVENSGGIAATLELDDGVAVTGSAIAIDLSQSAIDAVVRQFQGDENVTPFLVGDVRFGSGNDTLELSAGFVEGDVRFGAGADTFTISGGAEFFGGISDSDGQLVLAVTDGTLGLTTLGDVNVTSASFGDDASATFLIDLTGDDVLSTRLVASDTVTLAAGASLAPTFVGLGEQDVAVELINASGGLVLSGGQSIEDNLSLTTPFLFTSALDVETLDGGGERVILRLRRRTADELGLDPNQSAALDPVLAALNTDDELSAALGNISDELTFIDAYNQLLPDYAGGALRFALANVDGGIGAVANRLDAIRAGRATNAGVWIQEYVTYIDRASTDLGPGYRGSGFGVAAGIDRPLGPFYATGFNVSLGASNFEAATGFDEPISVVSGGVGAYAAAQAGRFLFDIYGGAGLDSFESLRRVRFEDVDRETSGEWNGYHIAGSARAALDFERGPFYLRPAFSLDYLLLSEEGYTETGGGDGLDLIISDRESDDFSTTFSITTGGVFGRQARTWWSPRLRVGMRNQFGSKTPITYARFTNSDEMFRLVPDDIPGEALIMGLTLAAGSKWSSVSIDYDGDYRDGYTAHAARLAFRFLF